MVGCPGKERALDGGAGIGRITKGFLMKNFSTVDLVEQDGAFLDEAKKSLVSTNHRGQFFHIGIMILLGKFTNIISPFCGNPQDCKSFLQKRRHTM